MAADNPRILLLDSSPSIKDLLTDDGYEVAAGTLGTPYAVTKSDDYEPVIPNESLPSGWREADVVIANLFPSEKYSGPTGDKLVSQGELDWWASASRGLIDPRPRVAKMHQDSFDRIHEHGGVIILFMAPALPQDYVLASKRGLSLREKKEIEAYPWSFLTTLHRYLDVTQDSGSEITTSDQSGDITQPLERYLDSASHYCQFRITLRSLARSSKALFKNKYGQTVGCLVDVESAEGTVILLPQFEGDPEAVNAILRDIVPTIAPDVLPGQSARMWLTEPPYEHPEVRRINEQIGEVRAEARDRIRELSRRIDELREERKWRHDLIAASGERLVDAVRRAFDAFNCGRVVDVDSELEEENGSGMMLREDLRLEMEEGVVVVEVKGLNRRPTDDEVQEVAKYRGVRIQETGRADLQGLTVINSERQRPPHERDTPVFRKLMVASAEQQGIGLLTTWDLFRLLRNKEENQWDDRYIRPLFVESGRIEPIPTHYQLTGEVVHVWPEVEAISVAITENGIRTGDRLAVDIDGVFHESEVQSLQIDDTDVEEAGTGDRVGVRLSAHPEKVQEGSRIFKVEGGH